MELILGMDRVECIAREFTRLNESGWFKSVKINITENDMTITPIADHTRIVLVKPQL